MTSRIAVTTATKTASQPSGITLCGTSTSGLSSIWNAIIPVKCMAQMASIIRAAQASQQSRVTGTATR